MVEKEARDGDALSFKAYDQSLPMVSLFCYLWWTLMATDDEWPAVVGNLRKARRVWACLLWILGWEGGGHADLREVLIGGSPGNFPFWVKDVGGDPPV